MIRNPLDNINYKTDDIVFQIIDWNSCDILNNDDEEDDEYDENDMKKKKKNKSLVIRGYGVTDKGNSICIHVEGFQPYFFFKIPQDWDTFKFNTFKNSF